MEYFSANNAPAWATFAMLVLSLFSQWVWRRSDKVDERLKEVHQDIKEVHQDIKEVHQDIKVLDAKFDRKLDKLTTILLNKFQLPSDTA